ncbi:DUF1611 domain-containing protein [Marinactinospora rubrisoli]|uniref:DUF1611 domain-containing protein n=1 Tax=Marinactinospora rubrisoli TaxID=2715399 RepID=A0ABW2KQ82_9ACTN
MPATTTPARVVSELSDAQRAALKVSYTVRALRDRRPAAVLRGPDVRPRHGDVVAAAVTSVGRHTRLELADGRRAHLFPGDLVLAAYAARYAPDQFEAVPPADLGPCHLVAAGGIAARVVSAHTAMTAPTCLRPLGLAVDGQGTPITMSALAGPPAPRPLRPIPTLAVVGTAMNSGKTTAGAALVRGLSAAGRTVGAAKITGTGAGGDRWLFTDSGAREVLDFTDAGLATTYRIPVERVLAAAVGLHRRLVVAGADAVVLEIADGVLQPETAALLARDELRSLVDGWVFAAGDAAGALFGRERLRAAGLPVVAVSGRITAAPLAVREAGDRLDVPVHTPDDLADPAVAAALLAGRATAAERSA